MGEQSILVTEEPVENTQSSVSFAEECDLSSEASSEESLSCPEVESLKEIASVKTKLVEIEQNIKKLVDTLVTDPSYITQLAEKWGGLSTPQKILGGVVLTVPALVLGFFAHIPVITAVGLSVGGTYTALGIAFDDHHKHDVKFKQRLEEGVGALTEILGGIIIILADLCKKLELEIAKFHKENERLTLNVDNLQNEAEILKDRVELLSATEVLIREQEESLRHLTDELGKTVDRQSAEFQANMQKLDRIQKEHTQSEKNLKEEVNRLEELRVTLEEHNRQSKKSNQVLGETIALLTKRSAEETEPLKGLKEFLETTETKNEKVYAQLDETREMMQALNKAFSGDLLKLANNIAQNRESLDRIEKATGMQISSAQAHLPKEDFKMDGGCGHSARFFAGAQSYPANYIAITAGSSEQLCR